MSSADIFQSLMLGAIALGGALVLVLGFAGGLHFEPAIRKLASAWLASILLFALGASTLVSGRNASLYGIGDNLIALSVSGYSEWVLRLSTAVAVGFSSLIVASALLGKQTPQDAARPLFLAFSLYFFATYVFSGLFGTVFSISYKTFYPFLVVFALYITSDYEEELLLRLVRDSLLIFLVIGLCAIPFKPDLVMQKGYQGILPGFPFRYWGLASHANNMGPLAVFFMLITCWCPYRRLVLGLPAIGIAVLTLAMAQSKTAFIAVIVVGGVFAARLWLHTLFGRGRSPSPSASMLALAIAMVLVCIALIVFVADIYTQPLESLLRMLQGRGTLLTGREHIWAITLAQWEASPLFGYGPALWGHEFTARYGYTGIASNAHNQFFDVLGSAGIFGAAALLVYALVLCRYAIRLAGPSKWVSMAMLLFFAARCISEVPLKTVNITTSDFIMHAVLIGVFMRSAVRQAKDSVPSAANMSGRPIAPP